MLNKLDCIKTSLACSAVMKGVLQWQYNILIVGFAGVRNTRPTDIVLIGN